MDSTRQQRQPRRTIPHIAPYALSAAMLMCAASAEAGLITQVVGTGGWVAEDPLHNGGGDLAQTLVGTAGSPNDASAGSAGLLFMGLPDLSAQPQILSAELSLQLGSAREGGAFGQVPSWNVDLYLLDLRSSLTINKPADYGELGSIPAGAVLIQDNWWVGNDDSQIGLSKTIDVTSAIQGAYIDGIPSDSFAVFALYGDVPFMNHSFTTYFFSQPPALAIAHVPEPATLALLAMGCPMLFRRRRRMAV